MDWTRIKKRIGFGSAREKRLLLYLLLVGCFAAWKLVPRPWNAARVVETVHWRIESTATEPQTREVGERLEVLYAAYTNRFAGLTTLKRVHPRLKVRLHKDRTEFRRIYPGLGWAEAFYKKPYARAYMSDEVNPYHWLMHEAVHQLNEEVAGLNLKKWLEEGLAEYFSVSRMKSNEVAVGTIDKEVYPVWWMGEIAKEEKLAANLENGSVIPLKAIITGWGGPRMNSHVNLYYLHWWTLTHFLMEKGLSGADAEKLLARGGDLKAVEELAGKLPEVEERWHEHVRAIRRAVEGKDLEFHRTGKLTVKASD